MSAISQVASGTYTTLGTEANTLVPFSVINVPAASRDHSRLRIKTCSLWLPAANPGIVKARLLFYPTGSANFFQVASIGHILNIGNIPWAVQDLDVDYVDNAAKFQLQVTTAVASIAIDWSYLLEILD